MKRAAYYFKEIFSLFAGQKEEKTVVQLIKYLAHFHSIKDKHLRFKTNTIRANKLFYNYLYTNTANEVSQTVINFFKSKLSILSKDSEVNIYKENEIIRELIFKSLHIISPENNTKEQLEILNANPNFSKSGIKEDLIYSILPSYLGQEFLQLIEIGKNFSSIIKYSENESILNETKHNFPNYANYNLDLSIVNPIKNVGIAIRNTAIPFSEESITDRYRRTYSEKIFRLADWKQTITIKNSQQLTIKDEIQKLKEFIDSNSDYFKIIRNNYDNPIYFSNLGLEILQLTLSPIAIARIQSVLLEYIDAGILSLEQENWNISIVERDLACAYIAIEDFKNQYGQLLLLENKKLPEIKLTIYGSELSRNSHLNTGIKIEAIESIRFKEKSNLLIDISVLKRKEVKTKKIVCLAKHIVTIRSAYSVDYEREIQFLDEKDTLISEKQIENFVKSQNNITDDSELKKQIDASFKNALYCNISDKEKQNIFHFHEKFSGGLILVITNKSFIRNVLRDSILKLNNPKTSEIEKEISLKKLANKQFLVCEISHKEALSVDFIESLGAFAEKEGKISTLIFDGANKISEWNFDFSPISFLAAKNILQLIDKFNWNTNLIAFSEQISYDSENDIKHCFSIKEETFYTESRNIKLSKVLEKTKLFIDKHNVEKEKQILHELLFNISSHQRKNKDYIFSLAEKEYNQRFRFNYLPPNAPYKLQVFADDTEIGVVDFSSTGGITTKEKLENSYSNYRKLEFLEKKIKKNKDKYEDAFDWLEKSKAQEFDIGIEIVLQNTSHENEIQVKIPFRNDVFNKIENLLNNKLGQRFSSQFIIETAENNHWRNFLYKIDEIAKIDDPNLKSELENLFNQLRTFEDTLLSLYRFSSTNINNRITIDYSENIFSLFLKKQSEIALLQNVENKIKLLKTSKTTTINLNQLLRTSGNSTIEKALNYYVNFINWELLPILRQNLLSLNNADRLKIREQNTKAFEDYKHDFFRNKYLNPNNVPNLMFDTEGFTNNDFRIVYKYINECRYNTDNLLHLKASTKKIKETFKKNTVVEILYAYSDLITNEKGKTHASVELIFDELMSFYDEYGILFSELYKLSDNFLEKLYKRNPNIQVYIEPVKHIKLNTHWLQNFNENFLQDYQTGS